MASFDVAVIGAGPGGYVAAIRAAQLGLSTCLIEKSATLGGTCLNVGCIPSKALLESSELFAVARDRLQRHGIGVGDVELDLAQMMRRKQQIVDDLVKGIGLLMKKNKVRVLQGAGALLGPQRVRVTGPEGDEQQIGAENVVLATGSAAVELPFMPFDGRRIISSTEALALEQVPRQLLVIGAGAIGLELGSVWSRLGAEVSVIELLPRIVPQADAEMAKALQRSLKKQGLAFHLGCQVRAAEVGDDGVNVTFAREGADPEQLRADRVLVAVGRRPYSDGLGLDEAGVALDGGRVVVDERFCSSVDGVYAIGDLIRGPMLAHKAEEEGVAVAEIIAGKPGHVSYGAIPNVVYTDPELAEVGLDERAASERGFEVRVGKFRFAANGRAKSLDQTEGLVKIVADAASDRLLGAQILGPRASELIGELVLALEFSASSEDIARTCHAHPTLAEVVKEAALAVERRAIHG